MKEDKNESRWDKLLNIRTMGRDDTHADQYRYPYEPTPYSVLERLANAGYIRKGNILLDYGCGKGRVDFFLSYQTRCKSIGIEYDERIYEKAAENKKDAVSSGRVEIELANAEEFAVPETADCMYFFNPFSVEILRKVMARSFLKALKKFFDISHLLCEFFRCHFQEASVGQLRESGCECCDIKCSDHELSVVFRESPQILCGSCSESVVVDEFDIFILVHAVQACRVLQIFIERLEITGITDFGEVKHRVVIAADVEMSIAR